MKNSWEQQSYSVPKARLKNSCCETTDNKQCIPLRLNEKNYNIIPQLVGCLAGCFLLVVICSVGPRGHSSGSKQGGAKGVTVGWEASEGSHTGMFYLTGHVLPHCSVAITIHMYAHKACWEQTSDI